MEQPTSYTLGEAMRELGIENRRTMDKWMKRLKVTSERHTFDLRFWCISAADMERIRAARAQMPAVTHRERRETAPRRVPTDIPLIPLPARMPVPTRKLSQGDAPDGWEPVPWWVRDLHKVPLITLQKGIAKGKVRVAITHERYKWRDRTYVENWLTPEAQDGFHRAFRHRLGDPCRACGWAESEREDA